MNTASEDIKKLDRLNAAVEKVEKLIGLTKEKLKLLDELKTALNREKKDLQDYLGL